MMVLFTHIHLQTVGIIGWLKQVLDVCVVEILIHVDCDIGIRVDDMREVRHWFAGSCRGDGKCVGIGLYIPDWYPVHLPPL